MDREKGKSLILSNGHITIIKTDGGIVTMDINDCKELNGMEIDFIHIDELVQGF